MRLIGYELGQEVFAKNGSYEMDEISVPYDEPSAASDSYCSTIQSDIRARFSD